MLKRKLVFSAFLVVFVLLASFFITLSRQYCVPIIMYHSVSPLAQKKNLLAVSADTFERQMRFLKEHRYNVVSLEDLASLIKDRKSLPPRTLAITLDDGYEDNFIYAFPILKKYNLPATIFIIINEVGRPQGDRLSWEQINQMQSSGLVTFGSHTFGPEPLTNIYTSRLVKFDIGGYFKEQIAGSKMILEKKLGKPVNIFSYPEGRFNEAIRQEVIDAGYKAAVATNPGKKFSNNDVFALKRLRISSNAGNLFIFWVETSGFYNFMRENRRKKAH